MALVLLALPAGAEVRLLPDAGGNFRVGVKSWWEIPFRSVVRQQFDFSCGSAAVATLLTYHYGRPTPERAIFASMWDGGDQAVIRKSGFSMLDMKNYLDSQGLPTQGYRLTVEQLKTVNTPSIVLLNLKGYKHFVVVKGVRGGRVLVGDPMIGLGDYSLKDFGSIWNGIALAVTPSADRPQPKFNLAGDWGPWARAPLEDTGMKVAAGAVTSNLPPDYQVSLSLLLDMRTGTISQ